MIDHVNMTAMIIGYVVLLFGGLAATVVFSWWCFEIIAKYAGWRRDLHAAIKLYRDSKRKEFPAG